MSNYIIIIGSTKNNFPRKCNKMASLESMGTEPTELEGTVSFELGEISSDGAGEESSSSTSTVAIHCLYWMPKNHWSHLL